MQTLNKEQAFQLISQAVAQFKGTLQEHTSLQEALKTLRPERPGETQTIKK